MKIVAKAGVAMQKLFGPIAEEVGRRVGLIVRKRKFTASSLTQMFVMGHLAKPAATDEDLAQIANQCGADVTTQAVEQRHTPKTVEHLKGVFEQAVKVVVGSAKSLAPLLQRFTRVTVLDSTTVTLPDSEKERFPGCGGSHGGGAAAVKLQTELDLNGGGLTHIEIEPGRSPDSATCRQHAEHPPGSLRITDLGYFNVSVFAAMVAAKVYFLSRLQFGTLVLRSTGHSVGDILEWLSGQAGPIVDQRILLGRDQRLPCRLIAWRLPKEQADERRRKLRKEALSKRNQEPTAKRLAWCDWTILVTSVSENMLTPPEAIVLYRARWQIELLFKRWKSKGLVGLLRGSTEVRQLVRFWSRLLAVLVQHWLMVSCSWGDPSRSWGKVSVAIRRFVERLLTAMHDLLELEKVIDHICRVVAKTCQRNKRSKPGTVELLNDVSQLDFSLT